MAAHYGMQQPPAKVGDLLQRLLPVLTPHQAELARYLMQDPQHFAQEHNIYPPGAPGQMKQPGESAKAYAPGQVKPEGQRATGVGATRALQAPTTPAAAPQPQMPPNMPPQASGSPEAPQGFDVLDKALRPTTERVSNPPSDRYFDQ